MVARDTSGLIVPFALPLLILTMIGLTMPDIPPEALDGRTPLEAVGIPVAAATVLGLVGIVNVPSFLASYRRTGVLRRLGVTPAGPVPVLVAQIVVGLAQVLVGIGLALVVAVLAFDAGLPASPWAAVGGLLLATVAFFSLGALLAALAPTTNAVIAGGLVIFLGTGALGGMFGDPNALPGSLKEIGKVLPFGATVEMLGTAWRGVPPQLGSVLGLVIVALVGAIGAARWFRWE
ncbi:ABC-2 type transporter [Pseudonocardia autotrophica]|uniref:ABC-2 type transporter n=2 Tax=Pseudonocardia TaxID=1847 RepID=A0A1Y2MTJ8_PSEAH|nr:ABC-2 type transporter [Pseudonocardia autotrophica]